MQLDPAQRDRAAGVLLGAACGDALGVPYEFGSAALTGDPEMIGGGLGPYEPGEYSDDTQMAVCIAEVAATGADLREDAALDRIAANFVRWLAGGASDVGNQTRTVLSGLLTRPADGLGAVMREVAAELHRRSGHTAGNGSLMRTGPVALAYLDDPVALAEAAGAVSELTHHDPLAGDGCVIWCEGIRRAVVDGTFDGVRDAVRLIPDERRARWSAWLDEAERHPPDHFPGNGFVVTALQAAWSAIVRTTSEEHFRHALYAAVRAGNDTDTIAAIAGALLGARWGAPAIPAEWRKEVHGWPGNDADDLIRLALQTASG